MKGTTTLGKKNEAPLDIKTNENDFPSAERCYSKDREFAFKAETGRTTEFSKMALCRQQENER